MAQQNTFSKVFQGSGGEEIPANSFLPTDDNGYIVAGYSNYYNGLIIKLDSACNVVWGKTFSNGIGVYPNIILNNITLALRLS